MWAIRQEQVETFRSYHLRKFEDAMVVHLARFAPKDWQVLGEDSGRQVIRLGVEQAKQHGFTNWGPVRLYLELMFTFGSYFDTDPQLPWAASILKRAEPADQMARAEHLFHEFQTYMARVRGPKHEHFRNALQRLAETPIEHLILPDMLLEESALRAFQTIYPQAHDYLGEARLRLVIQQSFAIGLEHGLISDKALLLMVGLSCFLGHRFAGDPLCGWIGRRLDPARFPDPNKRTEELYTKAMLYLKYVLSQDPETQA